VACHNFNLERFQAVTKSRVALERDAVDLRMFFRLPQADSPTKMAGNCGLNVLISPLPHNKHA